MRFIFCGFMGAGKSKLGRLCAKELNLDFVDLDAVIIQRAGMSIPEIFADGGEARFREVESDCLNELASVPNRILSLGGGAIRSLEHADSLKQENVLVWIKPRFEVILDRVLNDSRRPMVGQDPEAARVFLSDLYERRVPLYSTAHITFEPNPKWYPQRSAKRLSNLLKSHAI